MVMYMAILYTSVYNTAAIAIYIWAHIGPPISYGGIFYCMSYHGAYGVAWWQHTTTYKVRLAA